MMKMKRVLSTISALTLGATSLVSAVPTMAQAEPAFSGSVSYNSGAELLASAVSITDAAGYEEGAYVEFSAVSGATGYNVYVDGTQIDSMLIRQYSDHLRADAVGIKAGSHTLQVVPVINGKEDSSLAASKTVTSTSYDRTGFGWVNGTSSGAYNEDGTLKSDAVVLYLTESTKDTMTMDVVTSSKGATTACTGIQEIIAAYKKGYETKPLDIRVVGEVTDPTGLDSNSDMKGDLCITGSSDSKRLSCGVTVEGIGEDAVFYGFGIRLKNISNCEIRNMAVMLVDSDEGDNYSLQQSCDHIWVHDNDSFYGKAGSDADQKKGDGALDCKKSTYITFSYNHFYDNGKCNLLGLSEGTTDDLYITYHHNWYDHSDSRHPRVRYYSAHVYNNYYDGNAKYGIGSTLGSSIFSENNYFRNCKYPMLISLQGSDTLAGGTFSSEAGGIIKAFGNYIEGAKAYTTYQQDSTEFDAYEASSKDEKVPSTVTSKSGSNTYNNFDTSSIMYSYTADDAKDVPSIVESKAGRLNGGDFTWDFDDSTDDESYDVNENLMSALLSYKTSVVNIGSGFSTGTTTTPATEPTSASTTVAVTTAAATVATTTKTTAAAATTTAGNSSSSATVTTPRATAPAIPTTDIIYASPNGTGDGKTKDTPTDVLTAIKNVNAGGTIYLLEGTYSFSEQITIDDSNNGTAGAYKNMSAYPGANVVFDFTAEGDANSSVRGIVLDGDYWHLYGFEITKAADNGMLLGGSNNVIEMMVFNDNQDTGLQVSRYKTENETIDTWPSNNLILNCTSKDNCDDATMENADGFAAKLTCGEGNVFDGCMSYNNSDDGWDLFAKEATGPIGVVTIQNCVAFRNGYTEFGEGYGDCDGNGFKLGGSGIGSAHIVRNCLAFENLNCGFTDNNNPKLGTLINCTAVNNNLGNNGKANFSCYRCTDPGCDFDNLMSYYDQDSVLSDSKLTFSAKSSDKFNGTLANSIYEIGGTFYQLDADTTVESGDKVGTKLSAAPATSNFILTGKAPVVGTDFHTAWRNTDGSINTSGYFETATTSSYYTLGYHFANVAIEAPATTTTSTPATTTTTTTTTVVPAVTTVAATTIAPVETTATVTTIAPVVTTAAVTTVAPVATTVAETKATTVNETVAVDTSLKYGDVNVDETVSISDVVLLNKSLVSAATLSDMGYKNANAYLDTVVDSKDSLIILKLLVETITELPVIPEN